MMQNGHLTLWLGGHLFFKNRKRGNGMAEYKVKSWTHFFEAIVDGKKLHDMRDLKDRDYRVGDTLIMQDYDPVKGSYSGRECPVEITYITSNETPCAFSSGALHKDYCILSIKKI
jgi:hypothetical protein